MIPIIIEYKSDDETRIQRARDAKNDILLTRFKNRFMASTITSMTFTCPYCFEPFNTVSQAQSCRRECYERLLKNVQFQNEWINCIVKIASDDKEVFGRVVSSPDNVTLLVTLADGRCVQVFPSMCVKVPGL